MSSQGKSRQTLRRNPDGTFRSPLEKAGNKRKPKSGDVEAIIAGLQEGNLDRRTKTAMQFQAVKEALGEDPKAVAKALLRHDVAVYAVINRAILEHVQSKQGEILTKDGELPALVTRDLPKFQAAMTKAVEALLRLEGKDGGKNMLDVADIILDCEPANPEGE